MARESGEKKYVLYLTTYPPRECGIATFTEDLATAFDRRFNPATKSRIIALNESRENFYNYPPRVIGSIAADRLEDYVELAERVNNDPDVKIVNIQHEFGIFGGQWGNYLVPFLQVVEKPVVVTFHSVLTDPDDALRNSVELISKKAQAIIVMNDRSKSILETSYRIPAAKIRCIPHGIPQTTFERPTVAKRELSLEGKRVLTTFGMLSRDKGIEYAIRALPEVTKEHPDVVYLVIGATHPVVRNNEGEAYRNFLHAEVARLNLQNHVQFYNKYLSLDEIIRYLKATDVYIAPGINPRQSVSGTISYALGCGRPVISTPTEYAKYIINKENGSLVHFRNPPSIAAAVNELLLDERRLRAMQSGAYESTRRMTWPNVAGEYFATYRRFADISAEERKLPELKLDHLERLTDDFGILHHARYARPERRFGYSLDDNARSLIVATNCFKYRASPDVEKLLKTYLSFMAFMQSPHGAFARIATYQRERDRAMDEDVQGRGIWALGVTASEATLPPDIRNMANALFQKALKSVPRLKALRASAYAMTGLYPYLKRKADPVLLEAFRGLAERLLAQYQKTASSDWQWFEDCLTYSNSKLSEALFYAYDLTGKRRYLDTAETSLAFLRSVTFEPNHYSPIGQNGWYFRYKKRAYFDQQPEDTASMVETKIAAYRITRKKKHLDDAYAAFQWFLGKNHLNQMVYDEHTGGCHDGLDRNTMNLNQGAESTLSYLLARLAFEDSGIKKFFS